MRARLFVSVLLVATLPSCSRQPPASAPCRTPASAEVGSGSAPSTVPPAAAVVDGPSVSPADVRSYFDLQFVPDNGKYKVEGPFYIGDPVHETITVLAAVDAGYVKSTEPNDIPDLVRGVFWNDDPCFQLFNDALKQDLDKSTGLEWYLDFSAAEKTAKAGRPLPKLNCALLGRSHFGDLQFLHGMANADGVAANDTHRQIMSWLRFTYLVASEGFDSMAPLAATAPDVTKLIKLGTDATAADLFYATSRSSARERALGSLFHVIQDSYAAGHTNRITKDGCRGEVVQFYSYARQDHGKHAEDDAWRGGGTPRQRVNALKGGAEALRACVELLRLVQAKKPWADAEAYLLSGPMALNSSTMVSGPGKDFEKE